MESSSRSRVTMTTSSRPEVAEVVGVALAAAVVTVEEAMEAAAVIVVEAMEAAAAKWVAKVAVSITLTKVLSNLPKGRSTKLLRTV
jgi:hypothetical protein